MILHLHARQLLKSEQKCSRWIAFKFPDLLPVFFLFSFSNRQPFFVFGESLLRESAGIQQVVSQSPLIEIEFPPDKQISSDLNSFLGKLTQQDPSQITPNLLVFFLFEEFEASP